MGFGEVGFGEVGFGDVVFGEVGFGEVDPHPLKRGPKRIQTDFYTLRDMSKSSSSDSHKCNIVCSMLTEGKINIISSAYRKILVQVGIVLQPSPSDINFVTMSSINMA